MDLLLCLTSEIRRPRDKRRLSLEEAERHPIWLPFMSFNSCVILGCKSWKVKNKKVEFSNMLSAKSSGSPKIPETRDLNSVTGWIKRVASHVPLPPWSVEGGEGGEGGGCGGGRSGSNINIQEAARRTPQRGNPRKRLRPPPPIFVRL